MPALYPGQHFITNEQFPDITVLQHMVMATPPHPMCLYDYWIAYVREASARLIHQPGFHSGSCCNFKSYL